MVKFCWVFNRNKIFNSFTRIYQDVMGVNLNFLRKKVKGSDRGVSTVALHVFLSRTFSFILQVLAWFLVLFGSNMHS